MALNKDVRRNKMIDIEIAKAAIDKTKERLESGKVNCSSRVSYCHRRAGKIMVEKQCDRHSAWVQANEEWKEFSI